MSSNSAEEIIAHFALLDGGASYHMTGNKSLLTNIRPIDNPMPVLGFKDSFVAVPTLMGDMNIVTLNFQNEPVRLTLPDVRLDEEMNIKIFSEGLILRAGCYSNSQAKFSNILQKDKNKSTSPMRTPSVALVTGSERDHSLTLLYHQRFLHASAKYLRKLQDVVKGIPKFRVIPEVLFDCHVCLKAKSTRAPHTADRIRGVHILEIVNSDMTGPLTPARSGERFVIVIVDDFSLYSFVYPVHSKDHITEVFESFVQAMRARFPGQRVAILCSDSAQEYIYGSLQNVLIREGIQSDTSNPYIPEQDDRSEKFIGNILMKLRCLIILKSIPHNEWPFEVKMASYVMNRTPSCSNSGWRMPHELFYGNQPDCSFLRVPGSLVYVHIDKAKRVEKKFVSRALVHVLMGFESNGILTQHPLDFKSIKSCNF